MNERPVDLAAAVAGLAAGDVSSTGLVTAALAAARSTPTTGFVRIDDGPALAAAAASDDRRRAGRALSVLDGVPLAHKALFFRAGVATDCGSAAMTGFVPDRTSPLLQLFDAAGAVDVGTLHLSELALSPLGRNDHLGDGRNPWNPDHVSGGSSSGSGMAVASRAVFGSLGSDTGGSVRLPAAACGVTGLKPTHGTLSAEGAMPLAPSLDTPGLLAPSAADCRLLLDVVLGSVSGPAALEGVRVAVAALEPGRFATAETAAVLDAAAGLVRTADLAVHRVAAPVLDDLNVLASVVSGVESASTFEDRLREHPERFGQQVRRRIERGARYPAVAYLAALRARPVQLRRFVAEFLTTADVLVLPTLSFAVPSFAEASAGTEAEVDERFAVFSHWTRALNLLGLPALSVPAGFAANGLPTGVQLVGRPHAERLLLAVGERLQGVSDWHRARPPAVDTSPATHTPATHTPSTR